MSAAGAAKARGPEIWSDTRSLFLPTLGPRSSIIPQWAFPDRKV